MPRVSNGGKTYTFTIKRGFKFSNGTNVTAANFKRAFDRALNKAMGSPGSSFLDDVARYRTIGAYQFQVTLKKVAPDFLARMSMMFFAAVPTNTFSDTACPRNPSGAITGSPPATCSSVMIPFTPPK